MAFFFCVVNGYMQVGPERRAGGAIAYLLRPLASTDPRVPSHARAHARSHQSDRARHTELSRRMVEERAGRGEGGFTRRGELVAWRDGAGVEWRGWGTGLRDGARERAAI